MVTRGLKGPSTNITEAGSAYVMLVIVHRSMEAMLDRNECMPPFRVRNLLQGRHGLCRTSASLQSASRSLPGKSELPNKPCLQGHQAATIRLVACMTLPSSDPHPCAAQSVKPRFPHPRCVRVDSPWERRFPVIWGSWQFAF